MELSKKVSAHNFSSFLWHGAFLALARNFMDVDTIIPAMLVESGGTAVHIGLMTAIMVGGSSLTQLFFAPWLSSKGSKKKYLLVGINIRIIALWGLGMILFFLEGDKLRFTLGFIFFFLTLFSLSGAFANISYIDILGKSIRPESRKRFLSSRQIITGIMILISAFLAGKTLTLREFPVNYASMFFVGGSLLMVASIGFWGIREHISSSLTIKGLFGFGKVLASEWKQNARLKYFLGFINTQGLAITFLPFVVLYAKEAFHAQSGDTGTFLIFKVIGVVLVSAIVFLLSHKIRYNPLLYLNVSLSILMVVFTIVIPGLHVVPFIFILGGIVSSLYSIAMNGVLLEVSGNKNRAMYAGFAGAGNMLPVIFPLVGGWIIAHWGYLVFFLFYGFFMALSFYFIRKIECTK